MADYDIFISCKSEDYEIAEKVYSFLKNNGFKVFLSSKELRRMAQADYMDAISVALDTAYSMIVISTKKEYLTSKWVKFEWSTFLNEILSGRKIGQIMTLLDKIEVSEMPIQLRKYESFTLENYEDILPYLEKPKKPEEPHKSGSAEVHIETDIACRVMRFKEELITAQPDDDNLILLKKGTRKLTFVSLENEQDNYSQVYTVKDECEILQVNLTKIRDARLAKEEEERKLLTEDDAKYLRFERNGKYGFKKDGIIVIPAKYGYACNFSEGLAVVNLNGKWGYIDKNGKEVIPIKYDSGCAFSEGLARVYLNDEYCYIDKNGKAVTNYHNNSSEGKIRVGIEGKWGYVDRIGTEVIPIMYDFAGDFSEGLAEVKLNGKYGFIDKTGKEIIPIKFDYTSGFKNGRAGVKLEGKWGYIDKQGNFTPV